MYIPTCDTIYKHTLVAMLLYVGRAEEASGKAAAAPFPFVLGGRAAATTRALKCPRFYAPGRG
jgi:hypothetical protein